MHYSAGKKHLTPDFVDLPTYKGNGQSVILMLGSSEQREIEHHKENQEIDFKEFIETYLHFH